MHPDVDARECDSCGKNVEERCEAREGEREHRRGCEARCCVAGWERGVMRNGYERLRLRVPQRWTRAVDEGFQPHRRPVCKGDRDHGEGEDTPAAVGRAEHERDGYPQEPEPAGIRKPFEDRIQPARAMVDDPALEMAVEGDQAGTICFV